MIKSTLLALTFSLCCMTAKSQNATSIDEALKLEFNCASLNIDAKDVKTLPKSLNVCSHLKTIDYTNNSFLVIEEGLMLTNVEELNLSGTYINSWELNKISAAFPNLKKLSLSNSGLYFIGSSLVGFSNLESLDLSNNKLEFLPDDLQYLSKLKVLDLSQNNLGSNIGPLGYLWGLQQLDITENEKLSSLAVTRVVSLNRNLNELKLDYNNNMVDAVSFLKESPLSSITFNGPVVSIPKNITDLQNLKSIGFENTSLIQDQENVLSKMKQLNAFSFTNSTLSSALVSLPNINNVEIAANGTQLNDNLEAIASAKQLDTLNLENSTVSPAQLEELTTALPSTTILSKNGMQNLFEVDKLPVPIVKAETTTLTVSPTQANEITVKNVDFSIPANAFLDQNGKPVEGPVKLEITVYNDPVQIALAGAPMTFDNNGQKETFSSQGMLRVDAFDEKGNTLQPNPDNLINVSMPNLQPNTDGNLYFFNDKTQKWEDADTTKYGGIEVSKTFQNILDSINKVDYKSFVKIEADEPLFQLRARYKAQQSYVQITRSITNWKESQKSKYGTYTYYQQKNSLFRNQKFYIDTIVSKEVLGALIVRNKAYSPKKRGIKNDEDYWNEPRKVWNVKIEKDGDNDRMRLTFNLEDTTYSFPVVLSPPYTKANPTLRSSRNANTDFEFERRMAWVRDSLVTEKINTEMEHLRDSLAENMRSKAIDFWKARERSIGSNVNTYAQMNRLGFDIVRFGLVNCDFFTGRNPIAGYATIEDSLTDQNNVRYKTLPTVRVVYTDQFTYTEQPIERINLLRASKEIGIMILSSTLIGVIDFIGDRDQRIKKFRTIQVEGKSPDEVNRLIYGD